MYLAFKWIHFGVSSIWSLKTWIAPSRISNLSFCNYCPTRLECSTVKRQILINLISFTCHNYMNSSRWVPVECFWTAEKHFIWWIKCINITWNKNFLTLWAHKFQFHQITTAHALVFTPYNIHHMQQGVATVDMKKKKPKKSYIFKNHL